MHETKYSSRALSMIADRSAEAPTLAEFAISAGVEELCRLRAVNAQAAVGLALTRRDMRFYLRRDLSAREVEE